MRIELSSLMVDDQRKALSFYTKKLGFVEKMNMPMGEFSWITVVSSERPNGVQLTLEPAAFEPAKIFRKALVDAGIPWTAFAVDDLDAEYARLTELGVEFKSEPQQAGPVRVAIFDDTCGNLIQLYEESAKDESND